MIKDLGYFEKSDNGRFYLPSNVDKFTNSLLTIVVLKEKNGNLNYFEVIGKIIIKCIFDGRFDFNI